MAIFVGFITENRMVKNKLAFISNQQSYEEKVQYRIPRMYVRTDFDFYNKKLSTVVLSALSWELSVNIPTNCEALSLDELMPLLSNKVIEDNLLRKGKTRFFGKVIGYCYEDYKDRFAIKYDLSGNVCKIYSI